ncbi:hypothetical protein HOF92_04105 [bacterium]|nr:hypothetical protein [bacterium]
MSKNSGLTQSVTTFSLMGFGILLVIYFFYLNSILWNPWIFLSGREVNADEVHKLGVNAFYYREEVRSFSGTTIQNSPENASSVASRSYFRDGMLHHRDIFDPDSSVRLIQIRFVNEKVVNVEFWDRQGQHFGSASDPREILKIVKELNYERLYDANPL